MSPISPCAATFSAGGTARYLVSCPSVGSCSCRKSYPPPIGVSLLPMECRIRATCAIPTISIAIRGVTRYNRGNLARMRCPQQDGEHDACGGQGREGIFACGARIVGRTSPQVIFATGAARRCPRQASRRRVALLSDTSHLGRGRPRRNDPARSVISSSQTLHSLASSPRRSPRAVEGRPSSPGAIHGVQGPPPPRRQSPCACLPTRRCHPVLPDNPCPPSNSRLTGHRSHRTISRVTNGSPLHPIPGTILMVLSKTEAPLRRRHQQAIRGR